jgi:TolB protein
VVALALGAAGPAQAAYPGELGWIAITRTQCFVGAGCTSDLYRVTRLGTDETRLTNFGDAQHPSWSPDGEKLAFTHGNDIYTMNEDGTGMQLLLDWNQEVGRITWSPDGTRLAAALGVCDEGECRTDIHTFNADGTDVVNITPAPLGEHNPAWSPDGARIAFDSTRDGARRLYSIDPDGSGETQLTDQLDDQWPTWAPDSSMIVFASGRDGGSNLYSMNPDGTNVDRLTPAPPPGVSSTGPAFSPDGEQIAFGRFTASGPGTPSSAAVYRMSAFGGSAVEVSWSHQGLIEPDWQPGNDESSVQGRYPRPKGATPFTTFFVPAYAPCSTNTANRVHGPPLEHPSCAPPAQTSGELTIGAADANGLLTRGLASARLSAQPGNPVTGADEADVAVELGVNHVYRRSDLSEYAGELKLQFDLRITDKENMPIVAGSGGGTVQTIPMEFTVPCAETPEPELGGLCGIDTTLDSLVPGTVKEGARAVWQLGQLRIYDGGPDGVASTEDGNQLFQVQGLFVP